MQVVMLDNIDTLMQTDDRRLPTVTQTSLLLLTDALTVCSQPPQSSQEMSDQPPSRPKPGSLRDRIAAFENKPAAAPAPTPPRPKPAGGVSWKPRAPSPPSSPQHASVSGGAPTPEKKAVGGMNASDAKESIGLGGSLKERMAALQGKGAFGSLDGGAPAPPKPATQKPKWKPPPVVSPPADEETPSSDTSIVARSPPPIVHKSSEDESPSADTEHTLAQEGEEAEEHDPQEAERQRRAAIAARMARLGGTKVGMAPPVFGKKPSIKRSDPPKDEETQSLEGKPASSSGDRECIHISYGLNFIFAICT